MNGLQLAQALMNNEERMSRYREAVNILRAIGFENVIRRLGEPEDISLADPAHLQASAFSHAEMRGWYAAVHHIFYLDEAMLTRQQQSEPTQSPDFGADAFMQNLNFTPEEIAESKR